MNSPAGIMKTRWFQAVKFFVVAVIILYVINRNGGTKMLATMAGAGKGWVLLSAACFLLSVFLGACQWFLLLHFQNLRFPLFRCFKVYYLGMFMNALIFNLAGDFLRVYKLKKGQADITIGFMATFMDRFIGLFLLSTLSLLAVVYLRSESPSVSSILHPLLLISLAVFGVFACAAWALISRRIGRAFRAIFALVGLTRMAALYDKVLACLIIYRANWKGMGLVFALSLGVHTFRITGHLCCAPALGISIHPLYFFAFIPIISIAMLIPLNVGGWGLPQGIGAILYALPGVITFAPGMAADSESAVRVAAGSLTFLPSIIFYLIMLSGGVFISSDLSVHSTDEPV